MEYKKINYPDGTFYHIINNFDNPTIEMRINNYNDLFSIKQLKDILDYNKIKETKLIIPSLLDAQADRRFGFNESANLKLVCEFINEMKFDYVEVFHPHNQEVVESKINNVKIISNESFIRKVLPNLPKNITLFSTDAGSYKPLMKLADSLKYEGDVEGGSKSRKYNKDLNKSEVNIIVHKDNFENKDLLIIDDILIYGGTLVSLGKILKERNVGKLYAAISHTTVINPRKELEDLYEKIYTTNSKFDSYNLNNIEIIDMFNFN